MESKNFNIVSVDNVNGLAVHEITGPVAVDGDYTSAELSVPQYDFSDERLNALATEFGTALLSEHNSPWHRAELIAKYPADSDIWESVGGRVAWFMSTFGLKKSTVVNLGNLGNRSDLMKLKNLGFSVTQAYELTGLTPDKVRELVISGKVSAKLTCAQIRPLVRQAKGLPDKAKAKAVTVNSDEPKAKTAAEIAAEIEQLAGELAVMGIDTQPILEALRAAMMA